MDILFRNDKNETEANLGSVINIEEVRREAVKWVKSLMKDKDTDKELHWMNLGVISFIKHFFNLKEKDLKGGGDGNGI